MKNQKQDGTGYKDSLKKKKTLEEEERTNAAGGGKLLPEFLPIIFKKCLAIKSNDSKHFSLVL